MDPTHPVISWDPCMDPTHPVISWDPCNWSNLAVLKQIDHSRIIALHCLQWDISIVVSII